MALEPTKIQLEDTTGNTVTFPAETGGNLENLYKDQSQNTNGLLKCILVELKVQNQLLAIGMNIKENLEMLRTENNNIK